MKCYPAKAHAAKVPPNDAALREWLCKTSQAMRISPVRTVVRISSTRVACAQPISSFGIVKPVISW